MEAKDRIYKNRKRMIADNFIGGIAWSLGVVIGGTITLAILSFILGHINVLPVVGEFVGQIVEFVEQNQPNNFQGPTLNQQYQNK